MKKALENLLNLTKYKWIRHLLYWLVSFYILSYVFVNPDVYQQYSYIISFLVLSISIIFVYTINNYLIPRFLFKGKYLVFFYLIFALFILSIWLIVSILTGILILTLAQSSNFILPDRNTLIILLTGNYLIVFFAILIHFVNATIKENRNKHQLEKQKFEAELKLNQAKLELLKSQIHPHFLFNTLNNLYSLCLSKSENAVDVVLKISELLDYMLYKCDTPKVSLYEEISFLKNYIELEKIRNDQRLQLSVQFDIDNKAYQIAPLILFPFIENAFKHSAKNNSGNRFINIKVGVKQNTLDFSILNNYIEIEEEKEKSGGLGLENIKQRLDLIYPGKHEINIMRNQDEFSVDLKLQLDE